MDFPCPCVARREPHNPACPLFSPTSSPSHLSNSSSPSSQSMASLSQVFSSMNPYTGPVCYDAPMYDHPREPVDSHTQLVDVRAMDQYYFDPSFICISPPELQIPPSAPTVSPQVQHGYHHHQYQGLRAEIMLPAPSPPSSVDLPKRKGDRALARLQRSVRPAFLSLWQHSSLTSNTCYCFALQAEDPDRHWACTYCIQKFARKSDLTRHLKRHAGKKDYPCTAPSCPLPMEERAFFRADARRRHWSKSPACELEFYRTPEGIAW